MKLWLVRRNDSVSYDEYDSMVVRATDQVEAVRLCNELTHSTRSYGDPECGNFDDSTVTEIISEGEPTIILGSFNAG